MANARALHPFLLLLCCCVASSCSSRSHRSSDSYRTYENYGSYSKHGANSGYGSKSGYGANSGYDLNSGYNPNSGYGSNSGYGANTLYGPNSESSRGFGSASEQGCDSESQCQKVAQCRTQLKLTLAQLGYTMRADEVIRKLRRCYRGQAVCCPSMRTMAGRALETMLSTPEPPLPTETDDIIFPKPYKKFLKTTTKKTKQPPVTIATTAVAPTTVAPPSSSTTKPRDVRSHANFDVLAGTHCGFGLALRISGGKEAAPGDVPWAVMLQYREKGKLVFRCGGALISERYVLTAAHCILDQNPKFQLLSVRLGETRLNSKIDCGEVEFEDKDMPWPMTEGAGNVVLKRCSGPPQDIKIEFAVAHPSFKRVSQEIPGDIGIIKLKNDAVLSGGLCCIAFVMPICLLGLHNPAVRSHVPAVDLTKFSVAGWGMVDTKADPLSSVLQRVNVTGVSRDTCSATWRRPVNTCQLCAGGMDGNACRGDSGGPLMAQAWGKNHEEMCPLLVGVVSFGTFECNSKTPTVFSDVMCYLPWILDNVKPDKPST